jgi:hypothetical protein
VTFVDETGDVASHYEGVSASERPVPPSEAMSVDFRRTPDHEPGFRTPNTSSHTYARATDESPVPTAMLARILSPTGTKPEEIILPRLPELSRSKSQLLPGQGPVAVEALPSIYSDTPIWPLTDPSEALLLRHFVQNLAIWVTEI